MNIHLINHIDAKLSRMSDFVSRYMPVDISIDEAYEQILACSIVFSQDHMIAAFREAVKYVEPTGGSKRFNITMDDGRVASITVRFAPTLKWPAFLLPPGKLMIDPESKFAALLDTPIRVATEWESLSYVWNQLRQGMHNLDVAQLAYLLPWIRECLADFNLLDAPKSERKIIEKELATIMNDADVLFFPRMSKALSAVARSGKILFSQYRLIDAAYDHRTLTVSPITVERTPSLLEPWLKEHLAEALDEWYLDQEANLLRLVEVAAMKAAAKFDRLNSRSKS